MAGLIRRLQRIPSFWTNVTYRRRRNSEHGSPPEEQSLIHDCKPEKARTSGKQLLLQRISYIGIVCVLLNVLAVIFLHPFFVSSTVKPDALDSGRPKYLSLLIPSIETSDVELCKTILTAQLLRYPVPVVIPWGKSPGGLLIAKKDRPLEKLSNIRKYLLSLPPVAEDGIVILVDNPDTWFQLRPDVLLQRYYRITRQANKRLEKKYGGKVKQTVLFATHTDCESDLIDLGCESVPECKATQHQRPRCVGPGATIGPASSVRAIIERARKKIQQGSPNDIVKVYAEIYEEQNYQRELIRHQTSKWSGWHLLASNRGKDAQQSPARESIGGVSDSEYEFGIGLDYSNELGVIMSVRPNETQWISSEAVQTDIQASMPPFWTLSGMEESLPHGSQWSDIELLTVADTGAVPPMLYRPGSDPSNTDTSASKELWTRLWLTKYGRTLLSMVEHMPSTVAATVVNELGREQLFWNQKISYSRAGVSVAGEPADDFHHWQDMCGSDQIWKEVFRDSLGPWERKEWF